MPGPQPFPVISIAGPTASGKTAAALAIAAHLAPRLPVEIISVDSALVYRGMDIGTAKPSPAERAAVRHHLIDIRDPREAYSAAEFAADAAQLVADIRGRGALPLLVGGTMLYFKAFFEGLDAMPAADPVIRAAIEAEASLRGWPALHGDLAGVDPVTAARLSPNDSQRIQRALEVHRIAGQPLSAFHEAAQDRPMSDALASAHQLISLEPTDRAWLHGRIADRFDAMLEGGFLDEVRRLRARGDLLPQLPSMRCVGYRQAWEFLDGQEVAAAGTTGATTGWRDRGVVATRQLAKRQLTWLRSLPQRQIVAADTPDALAQVLRKVDVLLARTPA